MRTILLIGLAIWVAACSNLREEVSPDGLATESSKLVVACFISPQDTMLTAKVARSRPLLDTDPTRNVAITDAAVTLSDGQKTVQLIYDNQLRFYRASVQALPIIAGKAYYLTVKTGNGQQVTASATVPSATPIQAIAFNVVQAASNNQTQLQTRVSWQDPSGTTDFYQLRGQSSYRIAYQRDSVVTQQVIFISNEQGFFTDSGNDGALLLSPTGYLDNLVGNQLMMSLWHLDASYYRYHQSLALQQATEGNPFAEPVPIPTNIEGGLGCFGAYNQASTTRLLR